MAHEEEHLEEGTERDEFAPSQTPRQSQIIDVSSVERNVSNVTGDFKERIATYALDSPDSVRSLDATLTPVPEVRIPQSSPSQRRQQRPELQDEEINSDESDVEEQPVRQTTRNFKRTITSIITPSQMEAIIGPSKRGRLDETFATPQRRIVQTTLRDHFLRKADDEEVSGRGRDIGDLGLLSPEQVSSILAKVGTNDTNEDLDEMIPDDEEDAQLEVEQEDTMTKEGDSVENVEDEPDVETEVPIPRVETPRKSERNLFKSRQKNAVHNLHLPTTISLQTIKHQHQNLHQNLRKAYHPLSHKGKISTRKEYTESNEKAEERLSLTVSKEDFSRMRIVGQFNLGFIIAVRERQDDGVEDVFIIDQHASDEKYNFEKLQAETVMQVQTLTRSFLSPSKKQRLMCK